MWVQWFRKAPSVDTRNQESLKTESLRSKRFRACVDKTIAWTKEINRTLQLIYHPQSQSFNTWLQNKPVYHQVNLTLHTFILTPRHQKACTKRKRTFTRWWKFQTKRKSQKKLLQELEKTWLGRWLEKVRIHRLVILMPAKF